jgi:hypothetical protein
MTSSKKRRPIKVGMLVSYDYELIKYSLPPIYEYADKIVLAVDKDNKTWAGEDIYIPDDFWQWIKSIDTKNKIEIYRDSFYIKNLTALQCDTRERIMLAKYMGYDNGWHIQIDSDEYFIDFKHFVEYLSYLDLKKTYINTVEIRLITLFKRTENGFLMVKDDIGRGYLQIATRNPNYIRARTLSYPGITAFYPQQLVHDSWARSEEDLWKKLKNWGHNIDFNIEDYFHFWKTIDNINYKFIRDFHPLCPNYWKSLNYVEGKNINELLQNIKSNESLLITEKKPSKFNKIISFCIPPVFGKIKNKITLVCRGRK